MARKVGERLTSGARRKAIRQLQNLVAAGVSDDEARETVMQNFDVSGRTASYWLAKAYRELSAEADVDRRQLVGSALRTRRLILSRAMKDGDWRLALASADSISRLAALDAPSRSQLVVMVEQVQSMSDVVVSTLKDTLADNPALLARVVGALRDRLNSQLTARVQKAPIVVNVEGNPAQLDAPAEESGEAPSSRTSAPAAVAPEMAAAATPPADVAP